MKRYYILYVFICIIAISGCENKRDNNGDLGGMWQMTEWRDNNGNIKANKEDQIYLCFRKELARFMQMPKGQTYYFLSKFDMNGDSIRFHHIVNYPTDTIGGPWELRPYGIASNAAMRIETLNNDKLILSNKETGTLIYRKY